MKPVPICILGGFLALRVFAEEKVTFNEHIRPILSANCFACHGLDAKQRKAHLRLDQPESALAERDGVRAIVPGDLENSELWWRINSRHEDEVMPPSESHKEPLKPEQRELIRRWIVQGASYQKHWAYEPVAQPGLPSSTGGAEHPVDRFVATKLASHGLTLAPEAPREVLLRRLTLDLTGLPPTTDELDSFLGDRAPGSYDRAVDRLLASSRYGEHFARHWLDAVRYGDTHGLHLDNVRMIWPYRDWVVQAFNRNQPFDQFTIEQLAGDLLPNPRQDQLVASGYNRCNISTSEGGSLEAEARARNNADRIDTTAAVWLALTTNCASCHDHKFDPLTQREYYSLGAFFNGLADRVFDGNVRLPGPRILLGTAEQGRRMEEIARELPPLQVALTARAAEIFAAMPQPPKPAEESAGQASPSPAKEKKVPVTYEVVWAEDSDVPTVENFASPPPPGEWRAGDGVPVAGGRRALRVEGRVERPITFAAGDVPLTVRTEAKAFVHLYPDPAKPPRGVSLEFVAEGKTRRFIWGDATAFDPEVAANAIVAGPMPAAGTYARLELTACDGGLEASGRYTGLRVAQSDGAAWWDRAGVVCTSPAADEDPLLTRSAWIRSIRRTEAALEKTPVPLDIKYLIGLVDDLRTPEDQKRLDTFHRDYIHGPLRGAVEREAHAVRRLMAEHLHYELTLPASLIAREQAEPRPMHVLLRGQYDKPGDRVEPATPAFLPPLGNDGPRASRLDFARWLVDPKNPLPSRVTVNRFWQQLFGAGLVRTPSDFGSQGDPPTHPALLDWLAGEFMRTGWDVKRLVRLMVTSRTYRQDSRVTRELLELDPGNKLLARGPRFRLDGEILRDQALALGGLLEAKIGGPPVRPYQPGNVWEPVGFSGSNTRNYVQDHGAALYRRSLYSFWKRTAPPPAMTTFDAPSRESFCVGRGRSNTPLQALALMNDVQQFEAARAFAGRLLGEPAGDAERLARAFRSVTARAPSREEQVLLAETLATQRVHFERNPEAAKKVITNGESKPTDAFSAGEFAAWTLVTNLLLNLDETITRH